KDYSLTAEDFREADIRVVSHYRLNWLLTNVPDFAFHCPVVVLDEIHNLNPDTEVIVTKLRALFEDKVRVVALSGTIHEKDEIRFSQWLNADLIKSNLRPVPLVPHFVSVRTDGRSRRSNTFLRVSEIGSEDVEERSYPTARKAEDPSLRV